MASAPPYDEQPLSSKVEKAFDFAQEATKQLITLATGVIALTVTFLTDVAANASSGSARVLQAAWILYFISIVAGVFTLLSLAGNLERPGDNAIPSIYRRNIVVFSLAQVLCFCAAILLTLIFGWLVS
jgi:hypothetical protein